MWDVGIGKDRVIAGRVAYVGKPEYPAPGTYTASDQHGGRLTTVQDSGNVPEGRDFSRLRPLIAAAVFDAGFAYEFGPLSSWEN